MIAAFSGGPPERNIVTPRKSTALAVAAIGLLASGAVLAQQADKAGAPVLPQPAAISATRAALVNGKPVPKSRVDAVVKQQAGRGVPDSDQLRKAVVDRLVNMELVVQDAEKKGLTKNPDLREQMELARQQVIVDAYRADYFKSRPINDSVLKAEYEKVRASRG